MLNGLSIVYIPNGSVIASIILCVLIAIVSAILIELLFTRKKRAKKIKQQKEKQQENEVAATIADEPRISLAEERKEPIKEVAYEVVTKPIVAVENYYVVSQPKQSYVQNNEGDLVQRREEDRADYGQSKVQSYKEFQQRESTSDVGDISKVLKGKDALVKNKYDRSFSARLSQTDSESKSWYSQLKNEILSYKGVKCRQSWNGETFTCKRNKLVRFVFRGKTLCLYYALEPEKYDESKYKVENVSDSRKYESIPTMYRIKKERRCRYAKELVKDVMQKNNIEKTIEQKHDYVLDNPYKDDKTLLREKLIKLVVYKGEDKNVTGVTRRKDSFVRNKYDRSFKARVIQAKKKTKEWYSALKNEALAYEGVKNRFSWTGETFYNKRNKLVKFVVRGKTLCLYFSLDINKYAETKFKVENASNALKYEDVPMLYRIKNDRRCRYAKELIADVMKMKALMKGEDQNVDYVMAYPYQKDEKLLEEKLIKLIMYKDKKEIDEDRFYSQVNASQVRKMLADEDARNKVEESIKYCDKTKSGIINVDTLSIYFKENEKVTLEKIKERVPAISKKVTYIKVLARGTINKPLIVEADDFSLDAIKMIVLTGGKVIKTKVSKK